MVKIKNILLIIFTFFAIGSFAQNYLYGYAVEFTDKNNSKYNIDKPLEFLSQRAIDRRQRMNIQITEQDFPVNSFYTDSIINNITILHTTSKWLNTSVFLTNNTHFINDNIKLTFVKSIKLVYKGGVYLKQNNRHSKWENQELDSDYYGNSYSQISMCNAHKLHEKGFKGEGIQIAVLDGGFFNANKISGFDTLFLNNRILGTWDFVSHNTNVYDDDSHGMTVLSAIGGNVPYKLVGTAPEASYYLFRTENVSSEYPIEEYNWIAAAEMSDSLGVDIITSSLGYNVFDDASMNYSYSDMNGKTTVISIGAEIAFSKGMLVVNSAGNEGNNNWYYLTAPSDAKNVICVGAVDKNKHISTFSSRGPSADGRIKPDVVTQGVATTIIMSNGKVGSGSGTSYSCPVLTGMIACLWQAIPTYSNKQILNLVKKYSNRYEMPDNIYGYGIPDFSKASFIIDSSVNKEIEECGIEKLYPNPFVDKINFHLKVKNAQDVKIFIYDAKGVEILTKNIYFNANSYNLIVLNELSSLQYGCYYLSVITKEGTLIEKIIKNK